MNNPIYLIYSILLSGLILHGCSGSVPKKPATPTQPNNKVVWADDGSEVAVVVHRFEEKRGSLPSGTTDKRHFKHRILVQNLGEDKRRTITEWRDYQNGQIFYMKQAGYFVVESLLGNGARRFDKIALNGNEILIIETPDTEHQGCRDKEPTSPKMPKPARVQHTVIPSPDGQQLAYIYSPACGKVTVEFLHANNLSLFDSQTMDVDEPMNATWHIDGYVILATNSNAWKVTALAPPEPITSPKCLSPVTTSSDVSLEGKRVSFEGDKLVTKDVGSQKAFGCH
ncbi:MAG: hypothetical protein DRR08_16305 [Candidatus Parabeggiatoa sp. nov. 2]|nr:MAG: hypothetical protein B6247_10290 [Beggiatoa sp. 4572_84]RKZ58489.1 MAG: hypothetical protein DRR08_16305 [Gammaproteobacteria bacterium]HEC85544.1 hypothetical protein [Thioploca sp.]